MHSKRYLLVGLVLALISLACSFSFGTPATPTPLPPPTATPLPTQPLATFTPLPATPTVIPPTQKPQATAPQAPSPPQQIPLAATLYVHPKSLFRVHPPKGWTLSGEGEAYASFSPPDANNPSLLNVVVLNTGVTLDDASFNRLVDAYEQVYETKDGYRELRRTAIKRAASASKEFNCQGRTCVATTRYYQDGPVVIILDLILPQRESKTASAYFKTLTGDILYDNDRITAGPIYNDFWTYTAPNNLFTMRVPMAWYYTYETGDNLVLETFKSPDNQAYVESIVYDDGTAYSKTDAGKITLQILRDAYASDLKITDDQVQPDGSERLTWHSKSQDITGITFFETRDTSFLLLTMVASNATFDWYLDLFNTILNSYDVP